MKEIQVISIVALAIALYLAFEGLIFPLLFVFGNLNEYVESYHASLISCASPIFITKTIELE